MRSTSEEDYLKAIFSLSKEKAPISTNELASHLDMKPSSITDMLKKLADKSLVNYIKYKGVTLTNEGEKIAISIIRKHRLWETFLVNELSFSWDQVHDIAEQLEHIQSDELINRLDEFLGCPKYDPHGDAIPDKNGKMDDSRETKVLTDLTQNDKGIIVGVNDTSSSLLQYLSREGMILGTEIKILEVFDFDNSIKIAYNSSEKNISERVAKNLIVQIL